MLLLCALKAYVTIPAKKPQYQSQTIGSKNGNSLTKREDKQKSFHSRGFLHTLFLEYATETGGNKCKAVFYTYIQIGMRSLELFWPCSILAKNLGDVLAHSLSIGCNSGIKKGPKFSFHWHFKDVSQPSLFFPRKYPTT